MGHDPVIEQDPPVDTATAVEPRAAEHRRDRDDASSRSRLGLDHSPHVVLACRDREARKWGVRWLERSGFQVHFVEERSDLQRRLVAVSPSLVVVDASMLDEVEASLEHSTNRDQEGAPRTRVVVVCANDRQVRDVMDHDIADVVRRPVNWAVLGRRAALILAVEHANERLEHTEKLLEEARGRLRSETERASRVRRVDQVTGLPNSIVFTGILERALVHRQNNGGSVAVFHVDLNRFTGVNEILGRNGGDEILREVAHRLEETVRSDDVMGRSDRGLMTAVVARSNGVNFHILVGNAGEAGEVSAIARSVLDALAQPHETGKSEIYLNPSVGVAIAPTDGEDADRLLQYAESAMYEARRQGPSTYRFYNPSLNTSTERNLLIDSKLRRALELDELTLNYQPLVELSTGNVMGAEALLRWSNPDLGSVSPVEFIPIAEDSGLMVGIGEWVLRTACSQLREWLDAGLSPIRMSVNVARCQLTVGGFADKVRTALEDYAIEPLLLVLELSERGVLGGEIDVLDQLRELKALGVLLAVDDFGTGNSAISYLRSLELDVLKIDRLYVSGLLESDDDAAITSAMVAMAHQLRLHVVAEGAEASEQLDRLRELGCDEFQGFVFSPAVPANEFLQLVGGLPPGTVGLESPGQPSQ
jgi:diguanylate cyclase (GGDEF)-like protein